MNNEEKVTVLATDNNIKENEIVKRYNKRIKYMYNTGGKYGNNSK